MNAVFSLLEEDWDKSVLNNVLYNNCSPLLYTNYYTNCFILFILGFVSHLPCLESIRDHAFSHGIFIV